MKIKHIPVFIILSLTSTLAFANYCDTNHQLNSIKKNDVKTLRACFAYYRNRTQTFIIDAVRYSNLEILHFLTDAGIDVNAQYSDTGVTALHYAFRLKKLEAMQLLLQKGAEVDKKNLDGESPLMNLATANFPDGIRLLASHGADLNIQDRSGKTPLHVACENGLLESAVALLDFGASLETADELGRTPLFFATLNESDDLFYFMLNASDIHAKDTMGRSLLHYVLESKASYKADRIAKLLSLGAAPNSKDNLQRAPLSIAIKDWKRFKSAALVLVGFGAKVTDAIKRNLKDKDKIELLTKLENFFDQDPRGAKEFALSKIGMFSYSTSELLEALTEVFP